MVRQTSDNAKQLMFYYIAQTFFTHCVLALTSTNFEKYQFQIKNRKKTTNFEPNVQSKRLTPRWKGTVLKNQVH